MATRYAGSSKEKNALNLFIKFMRASNTVNRKNEEFIREYELNPGQFGVLESRSGDLSEPEATADPPNDVLDVTPLVHFLGTEVPGTSGPLDHQAPIKQI